MENATDRLDRSVSRVFPIRQVHVAPIECGAAILPCVVSSRHNRPTMRFVLYNIRYATGTGPAFHLPVPGAGYLRSNPRVLDRITHYLKTLDPDLVALIEVDTG